jgi:hypothetical protein
MLVWIDTGKRNEMLELRREVLYRRAFLRELEVNAFPPPRLSVDDASEWLRGVVGEIATLVSLAPQLKVLNLSMCCGDVSRIVQAAARNCMQLQSLVLPTDRMDDQRGRAGQSVDTQPLMDALYTGLPQWHRRMGGLRQLRLPSRPTTDRFTQSVEFLTRVISFCPKIELLDAAVSQWGLDEGMDEWIINLETWERFCKTCMSLREFDWVTVPWTTAFFEVFAKYPKPQLTGLTLKTTMQWDWMAYASHVYHCDAAALRSREVGAEAKRVHLVLQACPSLKRLTIVANSHVSNDDETLDAMLGLEEYDGRQAPLPYKKHNAMNQTLFGDSFCRALVRLCPLLEEFRLVEDYQSLAATMKRIRSIGSFQDTALESLAQLQHLSVVDVKSVNISGKGLFHFVNSPVPEAHGTRCYDFAIGEERGKHAKSFYMAVLHFLESMLKAKGEVRIPTERIYLCVLNGNTSTVDRKWSEGYLGRLKGLIRALRREYPTVTFRIEIEGLSTTSFATIYGFGFYTEQATQPVDSRWIDIPEEALEEDVFVLEEVLDGLDEDGEDEDDDDDDEDEEDDFHGEDDDEEWVDEDDDEFDSDDDDEDGDGGRHYGGRYYGGRYYGGRRRPSVFNGIELPDLHALALTDRREDEDGDSDDHAFDDQDGYDY